MPRDWWWPAACGCNAVLLGDPLEPLCSRVYRLPDSRARTAYMRAADRAFGEKNHCRRVYLTWVVLRAMRD